MLKQKLLWLPVCLTFENPRTSIFKLSISSPSEMPQTPLRVTSDSKTKAVVMEICHTFCFPQSSHPLHTNTCTKHGGHEIPFQYFQLLPLEPHSVIKGGLATFPVPWISGVILIMHVTMRYKVEGDEIHKLRGCCCSIWTSLLPNLEFQLLCVLNAG